LAVLIDADNTSPPIAGGLFEDFEIEKGSGNSMRMRTKPQRRCRAGDKALIRSSKRHRATFM